MFSSKIINSRLKGFSLIELTIVLALLAFLGFLMAKSTLEYKNTLNTAELDETIDTIFLDITRSLETPLVCEKLFEINSGTYDSLRKLSTAHFNSATVPDVGTGNQDIYLYDFFKVNNTGAVIQSQKYSALAQGIGSYPTAGVPLGSGLTVKLRIRDPGVYGENPAISPHGSGATGVVYLEAIFEKGMTSPNQFWGVGGKVITRRTYLHYTTIDLDTGNSVPSTCRTYRKVKTNWKHIAYTDGHRLIHHGPLKVNGQILSALYSPSAALMVATLGSVPTNRLDLSTGNTHRIKISEYGSLNPIIYMKNAMPGGAYTLILHNAGATDINQIRFQVAASATKPNDFPALTFFGPFWPLPLPQARTMLVSIIVGEQLAPGSNRAYVFARDYATP